jgi:hypothetical protein
MLTRTFLCLLVVLTGTGLAAPRPPAPGDVYGWELPRLTAIDTIDFPRRLVRNRSYGRVVAEISLRRDGEQLDLDYTFVENGDLTRWADKILKSARFSPALLDGSPRAARMPVYVSFLPESDDLPPRYEVWLPTDSAHYQPCLQAHYLAINEGLAPLLIRSGTYGRSTIETDGTAVFEVYVLKDGSREEGRLIHSPSDEHTRDALAALVGMQILPARFKRRGYGCWTRVIVGFCSDWTYPSQPVDLAIAPYRGSPAPVVAPVGASTYIPPQFIAVGADAESVDSGLLARASELVSGHALFSVRVDTNGSVAEWFRARPTDPDALTTDFEYLSYSTRLEDFEERADVSALSLHELARLAADELERLMPFLVFSPGRDASGRRVAMWIAVTPALFR